MSAESFTVVHRGVPHPARCGCHECCADESLRKIGMELIECWDSFQFGTFPSGEVERLIIRLNAVLRDKGDWL